MPGKWIKALIISLLWVILVGGRAHAVEEILDWHSDIKIHKDSSMTVSETIRVRAEGNQIKRGIYRDFPTTYKDRAGNRITVGFNVMTVERDGRTESYHTESLRNGVRLYVGKRDVFLKPGVYTYRLTYRTDRQLGYFEEHDELYWNVTGNGWEFPILGASAVITLPSPIPSGNLQMAGYIGPQGSRETNVNWKVTGPDQVTYTSGRQLYPREGLTIVLGWPKGIVSEPSHSEKALLFLSDNRGLLTGLAGLLVLLSYYIWAWIRAGKDPARGTIIPRFKPPSNLAPAAVRYILEMGFDDRAFASSVINLAVKGYITISEEDKAFGLSKTYILTRTGQEPRVALSKGERKVARKLFPGSSRTLKLEKENHQRVSGAIDALKDFLNTDYQKAHFINNLGYFSVGLLLSLAALVGVALQGGGTAGGPPILFVILWLTPWSIATYFLWTTRKFFMAAAFTFFLIMATGMFAVATSLLFVAAILFLVVINMIFYRLLKAPTRLGRRVMDKIEGFKMYLSTAEEHRLAKLHPPEKTPELFERYLPYALALEVDQEWSEKFADVLKRAAVAEGYSPSWYNGRHWDSMHTGRFASSLGSSLSSAISSSSSAPGSSSGFGGGGSSGGGGGGGGGGGW